MSAATPTEALLTVDGLTVELTGPNGAARVVDGVDLVIERGEVHAVVGESGSGKSVTALAIMGLLPDRIASVSGGGVWFEGVDLTTLDRRAMRKIQGSKLAMIFQEPMSSLNPAFTVGDQIGESMRYHLGLSRKQARCRAIELLGEVGIPHAAKRVDSYPHEFSGGMRQRVMIAIALACDPALLIADEPTTALDVTIQAQITTLLRQLSDEHGTAVMFITHDFGVVADIADRVTVLYAAQAIEHADVYELFAAPRHPYTEALLHAVPSLEDDPSSSSRALAGSPPSLFALPPGCRFAPRCRYAVDVCAEEVPDMRAIGPKHQARCIRTAEIQLVGRA